MAPNTPEITEEITDFIVPPPEGMVLPPKHSKVKIEKLAEYLVRRKELWERTYANALKRHRYFVCMLEDDPYNPYFRWRLEEIKEKRSILMSAQALPAAPAKKEPEKPKGPPEPPPYLFSARMPPNISGVDYHTIHLTASFTAKHGVQWMRQLAQRENANPSFDFLRTQHSYHQYFQRLVDQYKDLLDNTRIPERIEGLTKNVDKRITVLVKAKERAEWAKFQEKEKVKHDEDETRKRLEFSRIDWNDFQIIDTIDFTEADDEAELAAPIYLSELQHMSIEQKAAATLVPEAMRLEETMPWEEASFNVAPPTMPMQPAPFYPPPAYPPPFPAAFPPPPYPPAYSMPPPQPTQNAEDQASKQAHAMAQAAISQGNQTATRAYLVPCPNCGVKFTPADLEQHIKIELLDPDARKQQERAESRYVTINHNPDITGTMKRFIGSRPDLFDSATTMWAGSTGEQAAKRRKYY